MTTPRVLIVDDNVDLAENLREILEDEGCACDLADNGATALSLMARERFDVVICDLKMEGMSGLEVLESVAQDHPQVPVIIITAYARDFTVERAMMQGAIDVLAKPIDMSSLLDTVQRLLKNEGRILLVEDEDDLRANLVEILSLWPTFEVVAVGSVAEARAAVRRQRFDAAIVDVRLPDGSGLDLAASWPEDDERPPPALLFTTAYAEEAKQAGGREVLPKPFSPARLIAWVRKAV